MTQANDFPRWAGLGALQPLDDLVKRDGVDLDKLFFKSSIDGSRWNGRLIQYPFKVATSLMVWYNKDLFRKAGLDPDKPPRTWAELEEAAKKPVVVAGKKGSGEPAVAGPGEYVVKGGDSGAKIARAQGVNLADLVSVNPGVNWNKLKVGDKVKLPKK
jgi:LysM repeat protein